MIIVGLKSVCYLCSVIKDLTILHFEDIMKKTFTTLILAVVAFAATAGNIGYDKAAEIASRFVCPAASAEKIAAVEGERVAEKPYYIFNDRSRGNGFVIVAGNDEISPVLGYSDRGYIDENNLPEALRHWLESVEKNLVKPAADAESPAAPVVAPLVKTKWYQLAPYNYSLPSKTYLTGCVATAMAQVIRYHQWPERGHGSGSYVSFYGKDEAEGKIDYDLNGSTYDFANMRETYLDGNWTDTEANAVATLMRDCGFAAHMQYTTSVSSSFDQECAAAMTENFGYDSKVFTHYGTYRDTQKWIARMKEELDNGYPVIMNGQATPFGGGGHCFIADGYDSNGFIHINWGWNGDADGYYNICALTPDHQGRRHVYSYMQNFITAHPRRPYSDATYNPDTWMLWDPEYKNFERSGLTVDNGERPVTADDPAQIRLDGLFLNSMRAYKGTFRLDLMNSDGVRVKTLCAEPLERDEIASEGQSQHFKLQSALLAASAFTDVADGSYTIVPFSECDGMEAKPVQVYGYKDRLFATVKDGVATLSNVVGKDGRLRFVKPFTIADAASLFSTVKTEVTIANDGNNIDGGSLNVYIYSDDENNNVQLARVPVAVYEHTQLTVPISFDILPRYADYRNFILEDGKQYTVKLVYEDYLYETKEIEGATPPAGITIHLDPALVPLLEIESVKVCDADGNELDTHDLRLDLSKDYKVTYNYRTSGKGALPPTVDMVKFVFNEEYEFSSQNLASTGSVTYEPDFFIFFAEPGPSSFRLFYTDFLTGEMVKAQPESLSDIPVILYDSASVDSIPDQGEKREVCRYNSQGIRISSPAGGINIVVYSDGTVEKEIRTE